MLTSASWWKAAGFRALRTFLVVITPFVPSISADVSAIVPAASVAGFAAVLSLVTSMGGIPEATGAARSFWAATVDRVLKSVAQALAASMVGAAVFTDLDWTSVAPVAVAAGLGSLLLTFISRLPEVTSDVEVSDKFSSQEVSD